MARTSKRLQRGVKTRLQFETLENRNLLAVAAFDVNLYEDAGGVPGSPITDDAVDVGDSFFVEIMAREYDPALAGLTGVALDIAWDPNVLEMVETSFAPEDSNGSTITPHFPVFRDGTLDNTAGRLDNLSGYAFLASNTGRSIGNLVPERFALLRYRALDKTATTTISMREGQSGIATFPTTNLKRADLQFEAQAVTVNAVDDAAPDTAPVAKTPDTRSLQTLHVDLPIQPELTIDPADRVASSPTTRVGRVVSTNPPASPERVGESQTAGGAGPLGPAVQFETPHLTQLETRSTWDLVNRRPIAVPPASAPNDLFCFPRSTPQAVEAIDRVFSTLEPYFAMGPHLPAFTGELISALAAATLRFEHGHSSGDVDHENEDEPLSWPHRAVGQTLRWGVLTPGNEDEAG